MGHVSAGVAVGVHEQLGVGVDGDEGLEVAVALDQVHHVLHLNLRVSRGAVVGFRAGVPAGTGAWREEMKREHIVDIITQYNTYIQYNGRQNATLHHLTYIHSDASLFSTTR